VIGEADEDELARARRLPAVVGRDRATLRAQEIASTLIAAPRQGVNHARPGVGFVSQFVSHSPLCAAVHRRPQNACPPFSGRSPSTADGRAQSSNACEPVVLRRALGSVRQTNLRWIRSSTVTRAVAAGVVEAQRCSEVCWHRQIPARPGHPTHDRDAHFDRHLALPDHASLPAGRRVRDGAGLPRSVARFRVPDSGSRMGAAVLRQVRLDAVICTGVLPLTCADAPDQRG
jgi:hypothetical protein